MEKMDPVRGEIIGLVTQYCGENAGKFFADHYLRETMPVFLNRSFRILKELAGPQKAHEQLDSILHRYSVRIPYS
jgi:hypothetical protein